MRIIDFSRPLENGMQVYPGDEAPQVAAAAEFDRDGCRAKQLTLSTHTGTHMDAPAHMTKDGATLDAMAPETFFGFGLIADVRSCAGRRIERADLGMTKKELAAADFLLLYTGWDEKFGAPDYMEGFPVLSEDAARFLTELELKGVGFDAVSADAVDTEDYAVHKILLGAGLVIIENLTGLGKLPAGIPFCLTALPMAIKEADGAPARVMAVLEK